MKKKACCLNWSKGFAHILVLLVLVIGLAAGLYLVNSKDSLKLFSKAASVSSNQILLPQYLRPGFRLTEDFDKAEDWEIITNGGSRENADVYKTGSGAVKFTSVAGKTFTGFRKPVGVLDLSGMWTIRLWINQPDWQPGHTVDVVVQFISDATGGHSNYFTNYGGASSAGWMQLNMWKSDFTATGNPDWSSIRQIQISVKANVEGDIHPVIIDGLYRADDGVPVIVMTLDDGSVEQYTEAGAILAKYGLRASVAVIMDRIGDATHMSVDQLKELYNRGWDMVIHSDTGEHHSGTFAGYDEPTQEAILRAARDQLITWGMLRGANEVAFPLGRWNDDTVTALINTGMRSGRADARVPTNQLPFDNIYHYPIHIYLSPNLTLAQAKEKVDVCVAKRIPCVIVGHRFYETQTLGPNDWRVSDFGELVRHTLNYNLPWITMTEYRSLMDGPVSVPTPNPLPTATPSPTPTPLPTPTQSANNSSNQSPSGGGGNSNPGAPACVDAKPGGAPKLLSASAGGKNQVNLSWSKAPDPVTYYLVAYGSKSGKMEYGNPNVGGKGTTSYIVKGLENDKTYYFRVRAGNVCAPGDFSNEMVVKAAGDNIPSKPAVGFKAGVLGTEQAVEQNNNSKLATSVQPPRGIIETLAFYLTKIITFLSNIFK